MQRADEDGRAGGGSGAGPEGQFRLFPGDDGPPAGRRAREREGAVAPAGVAEDVRVLAERLPGSVRLGTSSWSFPGWRGLIFAGEHTPTTLARRGLSAYAAHPLLRTVGIDRTFYGPVHERVFAQYAAQVPEGFRFLVKAYRRVLAPRLDGPGEPGGPNPDFLDVPLAVDEVIGPAVRGLGSKLGPIHFQFSPMRLRDERAVGKLLERLSAFLQRLPRGPVYAVELRNAEMLTPRYAEVLASAGVCHGFNVHPTMPDVVGQAAALIGLGAEAARTAGAEALRAAVERQPAVVARWMLHAGLSYDDARVRYAPFDRLVDPDPPTRSRLAALCQAAASTGREAWVIANNKAEGSAPETLRALAERIASGVGVMGSAGGVGG